MLSKRLTPRLNITLAEISRFLYPHCTKKLTASLQLKPLFSIFIFYKLTFFFVPSMNTTVRLFLSLTIISVKTILVSSVISSSIVPSAVSSIICLPRSLCSAPPSRILLSHAGIYSSRFSTRLFHATTTAFRRAAFRILSDEQVHPFTFFALVHFPKNVRLAYSHDG